MLVPAMAWNSSPWGPEAGPACCGEAPASTCTPGAVMSGLLTPRVCAGPPRELNEAMTSPCWVPVTPVVIVAISPVLAARKARSCVPCAYWMWVVGR